MPPPTSSIPLQRAYKDCLIMATEHYENFPVASWLLPRRLRQPIAAIYAFARLADDLADEGNLTTPSRIEALDHFEKKLSAIVADNSVNESVFIALGDTLQRHRIPANLLFDLLSAFRQDVCKKRYQNFEEVLDYCRLSANPIGRMLLHLEGEDSPDHLVLSDAICTALQLINFFQDLHSDYIERGRIYLPLDEMRQFGITEEDIGLKNNTPELRQLLHQQYDRAAELLRFGAPLGQRLKGRLGLEIRAIIAGGARVLYRLEKQEADLFSNPRLTLWDRITILSNACLPFHHQ